MPEPGASLDDVWPEVRRRLMRQLQRSGFDRETAEDLTQEVAARAVRTNVHFDSADDLMRWTSAVAHHLGVDHWRAAARRPTTPLVDGPAVVGLDEVIEHRRRLEAVLHTWPHLSERDRHALSAPFTGVRASSRAEAVRWAVRRHAARARLAALVDARV